MFHFSRVQLALPLLFGNYFNRQSLASWKSKNLHFNCNEVLSWVCLVDCQHGFSFNLIIFCRLDPNWPEWKTLWNNFKFPERWQVDFTSFPPRSGRAASRSKVLPGVRAAWKMSKSSQTEERWIFPCLSNSSHYITQRSKAFSCQNEKGRGH